MKVVGRDDVEVAARAVEAGGLVIVPTSRWYMLCCSAENGDACQRVFRAKRRPPDKSLLLLLPSREDAGKYFHLSPAAERLIREFWPGDLSLHLTWKNADIGKRFEWTGPSVALVGNPSGELGALSRGASPLVAATSANISGSGNSRGCGPAVSFGEVLGFIEESGCEVAVAVDGGICPHYVHTTVVDCSQSGGKAAIVREGAVHRRAIEAVLGVKGSARG
jgi:L-threonylcarbamoyladenylate synthase